MSKSDFPPTCGECGANAGFKSDGATRQCIVCGALMMTLTFDLIGGASSKAKNGFTELALKINDLRLKMPELPYPKPEPCGVWDGLVFIGHALKLERREAPHGFLCRCEPGTEFFDADY